MTGIKNKNGQTWTWSKTVLIIFILFFTQKKAISQSTSCSIVIRVSQPDSALTSSGVQLISTSFNFENCDLVYSDSAIENGIEGKISFTLFLNDRCKVDSVKIIEGLGFGLDEIVVTTLQNATVVVREGNVDFSTCEFLKRNNLHIMKNFVNFKLY